MFVWSENVSTLSTEKRRLGTIAIRDVPDVEAVVEQKRRTPATEISGQAEVEARAATEQPHFIEIGCANKQGSHELDEEVFDNGRALQLMLIEIASELFLHFF